MKQDYYSILGVSKQSTQEEIKKAYKKKVLKHHPDRADEINREEAKKHFQEIQEAYDVLSDEKKKNVYDQLGHDAFKNNHQGQGFDTSGFGGFDASGFENIFTDFFGNFNQTEQSYSRAQRGEDLRYAIKITLEQAFTGFKTMIKLPKMISCSVCFGNGIDSTVQAKTCSKCNGSGRIHMRKLFLNIAQPCDICHGVGKIYVKCKECYGKGRISKNVEIEINIPKGISDGVSLRMRNEGNAGIEGGPNGDLFISIQIQKHSLFEIDGVNLSYKTSISVVQAVLGATIKVPLLCEDEIEVQVKPGTQALSRLKLSSKGMPALHGSKRGDMYIIFDLKIPTSLSTKEKELWVALSNETDQSHKKKGFWG